MSNDFYLFLEVDGELLSDTLLYNISKSENVSICGIIIIDKKIGMNLGYFGATNPIPFESNLINQSSCGISFRIAEKRSTGETRWLLIGTKCPRISRIIPY